MCFHYEYALRDRYPSVAPLHVVDVMALRNVPDISISCITVLFCIDVSGVVLMSYQFKLSSLHCILNCGAVVVIVNMFTISCTLLLM